MVVNYKEHGFRIVAKALPESCTACPFWLTDMKTLDAMCYITGRDVPSDPKWDEIRMDNCPIEKESADVSEDATDTNVGNIKGHVEYDGKVYVAEKPQIKCIAKDGEITFGGFREE